jgi:hypothetical protein
MTTPLRQTFTADDRELVHQLLEDMRAIHDQFVAGVPKPSANRTVFAPILRRWIAEGLFFKAQKYLLPLRCTFMVYSDSHNINLCKAGMYEHWMASVMFRGMAISIGLPKTKYLGKNGMPNSEFNSLGPPQEAGQSASIFFKQKMFFWKEQFYTRSDVIRMHANTLGGVHFDFKKAHAEQHIMEIKNYLGYETRGSNIQMILGEEIINGRSDPSRRQQIYDATELVVMDTARIFANGLRASETALAALLA